MTRVLLTDGDQRSTLAAARALGEAGIEVFVAETAVNSLASRSRHCRGSVVYPTPFTNERGFIDAITAAAVRLRLDLVIPMTDITSAVLAEHRAEVSATVALAVVDADQFWNASDKNALHVVADRLGLATPTVHYVNGPGDLAALKDAIVYPCVVKPARSRVRTPNGWIKSAVRCVNSWDELEKLYQSLPELQYPSMLQRVIDGPGIGVFALCDRGEPKMMFAHRRLREKPPWGGVSVLREAIPVEPAAADYASTLLKALEWHGVAMVEFKKDSATGALYLMEVNARFWGSLQLAIDAGANFPLHAVRLWLGEAIPSQPTYRTGIRSRWLLGDLDHLLLRLSSKNSAPADAPPVSELLVDFCRFFRRDTRYEIESWRDPGPSIHEVSAYVRDLFRSLSPARH